MTTTNRRLPSGAQFLNSLASSIAVEAAAPFDIIAGRDKRIADPEAEVAALLAHSTDQNEFIMLDPRISELLPTLSLPLVSAEQYRKDRERERKEPKK